MPKISGGVKMAFTKIKKVGSRIKGFLGWKLFGVDRRKNITRPGQGMPDLKPGDPSFTQAKTYLIKGGKQKPNKRAGQN